MALLATDNAFALISKTRLPGAPDIPTEAPSPVRRASPNVAPTRKCSRSAPTSGYEGGGKDLLTLSSSLRDPTRTSRRERGPTILRTSDAHSVGYSPIPPGCRVLVLREL